MKTVETKTVLRNELVELLTKANIGCSFCSVTYTTEPNNIRSPKTSGMAGRIQKTVTVNPLIGGSMQYVNAINNRLAKQNREAIEAPKPRQWGVRLTGTPFVTHTNKKGETHLYLEAQFLGKPTTKWYLGKKHVAYSEIEPYLRPTSKTDTYDIGDDAPQWKDIRLDHINALQVNHIQYIVVG